MPQRLTCEGRFSRRTRSLAPTASPPPEPRDYARRPEQVLEVGPSDADDAGADLHGAELAVGDELADEALGHRELVGGLGDGQERRPGRIGGDGRHGAPSFCSDSRSDLPDGAVVRRYPGLLTWRQSLCVV